MFVTVFRHQPPPVIGMCGTTHHHTFENFEAVLDWLETTGILVERFDPKTTEVDLAKYPTVKRVLAAEGDGALPVIAIDDAVISRRTYLSRGQMARLIGDYRRRFDTGPRVAYATGGVSLSSVER